MIIQSIFSSIFKPRERLFAVDVGGTSLKLLQLEKSGEKYQLESIGKRDINKEIFEGAVIKEKEYTAEHLSALVESCGVELKKVVTCVPSQAMFMKRHKVLCSDLSQLSDTIRLEAANIVPHKIDAVYLDYHIVGIEGGKNVDVILVAVKNEVVYSITEVFGMAGLEVAVLDVDIFALQNAVELNIKSAEEKLIGIVKVGGKNSTISIVRNGVNLFTSDVGTGGRSITEVISTETGASFEEAEKIKRKLCLEKDGSGSEEEAYLDALHKGVEYVAQEIHKQFNYLLSAVDSGELSVVYASGGGVQSKGLLSALSERLGVPVEQFNPFSVIEINEELHDLNYVKELSPFMGTAVGLAIREVGDKVKAEDFVE